MLPLLALLATAASDPAPSVRDSAVAAFTDICLAQRGAGIDATRAAILRVPGVARGETLPVVTGSLPMETYRAGELEFMLRPGKQGAFGCFVAYKPEGDDTATIVAALNAREDLRQKPFKASKRPRYEWVLAGGGNDGVYVTPDTQIGGMLLNLEVGRK